MVKFSDYEDISPFPISAHEVDVGWPYIENHLKSWADSEGLDLDPDFQRPHVWSEHQQRAFVEYLIQNGPHSRVLYFACKDYAMGTVEGPLVIVDGKQRLEAVRRFMRNELTIFDGHRLSDFKDKPRLATGGRFKFCVASLDRAATLRLYIAINASGTPHTKDELARVRRLLFKEDA